MGKNPPLPTHPIIVPVFSGEKSYQVQLNAYYIVGEYGEMGRWGDGGIGRWGDGGMGRSGD